MGFPQRLKELRESKKISQAALSKELGIPRSSISHYEDEKQGQKEIRLPRRERLEQIADFFDVSVDYLLGRTDVSKATQPVTYERAVVREPGVSFETRGDTTGMSKILFANDYPRDLQVFLLKLAERLETIDLEQRAEVVDELTNLLQRYVPLAK